MKRNQIETLLSYLNVLDPLLEKIGPSITKQEICYSMCEIFQMIFNHLRSLPEALHPNDTKFWSFQVGKRK